MGWDNTNKLMYSPLTTWDVAAALGVDTGDLGYAIVNGTINKWARYKPMVAPNALHPVGYVETNERRADKHGFTIPTIVDDVDAFVQLYPPNPNDDAMNGWVYHVPRGRVYNGVTVNEYFRMYDFLKVGVGGSKDNSVPGYSSRATNPFGSFSSSTQISMHSGTIYAENNWIKPALGGWPDYYLAISDFNTLPNMYYGFILYPNVINHPIFMATADEAVNQNGQSTRARGDELLRVDTIFESEAQELTVTPYRLIPLLSSQRGVHANDGPIVIPWNDRSLHEFGTMIPIPGAAANAVSFIDHYIGIEISAPRATVVNGTYTITFSYRIVNRTGTPYIVRGDMVMLRLRGKGYTTSDMVSPPESAESIANVVNTTVPANSTSQTYTYTKSGLSTPDIQTVWVGILYGQTGAINPMQESATGIMYPAINE